jgi:hypothetical protein
MNYQASDQETNLKFVVSPTVLSHIDVNQAYSGFAIAKLWLVHYNIGGKGGRTSPPSVS